MTTFYSLVTYINLLLLVRRVHLTTHGCQLEPSDLGPDWYKVQQPTPVGSDISKRHYIHMPCAVATVFDVGICGCTNMEAYLFSGVQKTSVPADKENLDPLDFVKQRDPDEFKPQQKESSGSILLNTRTGEVTHCPFRASSRGSKWYLIREPTDVWRPMKCAPGTVFQKKSCTCIHLNFASREPSKPEDDDIVVLENEYDDLKIGGDDTISATLQIKVSDVDFRSPPSSDEKELWLRQSVHDNQKQANTRNEDHKTIVVRFPNGNGIESEQNKVSYDRVSKIKTDKNYLRKTSPMFLDTVQNRNARKRLFSDDKNSEFSQQSLIFTPFKNIKHLKRGRSKQSDQKPDHLDTAEIVVVKKTVKQPDPVIPPIPQEQPKPKEPQEQGLEFIGHSDTSPPTEVPYQTLPEQGNTAALDEIFFPLVECAKRPIPDLGPEYFSLYLWGVGWIPYACHGNRIYSDLLCACIPSSG